MTVVMMMVQLAALILTVELAMLVHGRMYLSTALNVGDRVKGPPLFKPRWRLLIYGAYLIGGVAALDGRVPKSLGIVLILVPIAVLVILDLRALRNILARQRGDGTSSQPPL